MWIPHLPQLQPNTNHPQFHAPPNQKESKCRMRPKDLRKFNIDKKMFEQSPGKKHKKKEPCIYTYIYTHHISKYINTLRYKWLRIKKHQPGNCANMWPFWGVWFSRDPKKNWVVVVVGDLQIGNRSSWVTAAESPGSWSYLSGLKKNKQTHPKRTDP